ncbi:MAG: 16S rRNA (uracil(1498)-N(3))-methyltransferase [bacterium]|nr:16S rRNA (uracil(1498)-N(3))-methyltransferase [bacterium]
MSSKRRFYSDSPVVGDTIAVIGEELHHLRTVNRAQGGDPIEVFDGAGNLYSGQVRSISNREASVAITGRQFLEKKPASVIIAPSLTKKRAMNVMVEKLTEMGVDEIRPLIFARTDESFSASMLKKWQRLAVQSLKVNKRLWATDIYAPVTLDTFCRMELPGSRMMFHIEGRFVAAFGPEAPVTAIIGPPGDFTSQEREILLAGGAGEYKLNDCILKSETAAISAAALLKANMGNKEN